MKQVTYVGAKIVKASPMSRGSYSVYRGWQLPADENPHDRGYLVEYTDGGKPNDERHAGYITWSPADVFERAYRPVDDAAAGASEQVRVNADGTAAPGSLEWVMNQKQQAAPGGSSQS